VSSNLSDNPVLIQPSPHPPATSKVVPATLFDNFERRPLPMPCSRAGQQGANRLNRLTVAADHAADIALSELQPENRGLSTRDLSQHHLIRKFHQLPHDELEKLFHVQLL
jgi:hypothetical protein